jgi:Zn-dependent protease
MWPPESALWERALELTGRLNLFLALFNLLPIQPLDGGKLLFLYLIRVISPLYATRICGWIGLIAAVLWIPLIYVSIVYLGFVLLFFPSFKLHWELARAKNEN